MSEPKDKTNQPAGMGKPTPPVIDVDAIRAKYPQVIVLDIDLGAEGDEEKFTFAFGRPKRQHVELAMSGAAKKFTKNMANMVGACLLSPDRDEAEQIFNHYPGAVLSLGNALLEAVGVKDAQVRRP